MLDFPSCIHFSKNSFSFLSFGGGKGIRTPDLLLARQALSQLSYTPLDRKMVGLSRFELLTSRLSGVRSDQLSYRPILWLNKYKSLYITGFILFSYYFIKYIKDLLCKPSKLNSKLTFSP